MSDQSPEWLELTIDGDGWDPMEDLAPLVASFRETIPTFGNRPLKIAEILRLYEAHEVKVNALRDWGMTGMATGRFEGFYRVSVSADLCGPARKNVLLHELAHCVGGHLDGIPHPLTFIVAHIEKTPIPPMPPKRSHLRYRQEDIVCDTIAVLGAWKPSQRRPERVIAEIGHFWGTEPAGIAERDFRIRTACELADQIAPRQRARRDHIATLSTSEAVNA